VGSSSHSKFYSRSVNLEVNLDAGDYVVHVSQLPNSFRAESNCIFIVSQVRLDRELVRSAVRAQYSLGTSVDLTSATGLLYKTYRELR
jgi:hypothetical protein